MWQYIQVDGALSEDGTSEGTGYSGHDDGLNNPDMEAVHGVGPIPQGLWLIGPWHSHYKPQYEHNLGPIVAALTPIGHDAHGRSGFFIHGDNADANHTASDGCIILNRTIRQAMRDSGDDQLTVISKENS